MGQRETFAALYRKRLAYFLPPLEQRSSSNSV